MSVVWKMSLAEDQVAPVVKKVNFDCSELTENTLYALNQIRNCHITPGEIAISIAKVAPYAKRYRRQLNATKCQVRHQREKWHCGHHDHTSTDHAIVGITSGIVISPEQCRTLAKGREIIFLEYSGIFGSDKKPHRKNLWWHQRRLQKWMKCNRLDHSWHFPSTHTNNNIKSYDGKWESLVWYGTKFATRLGRFGMWNFIIGPISLHLGIFRQLCNLDSLNWRG